jgi:hypothetical protein
MAERTFDLSQQQMRDQIVADEQNRLQQYRRAWEAYYGQHKKPLRIKKNQPDDNVIVNYIRLAVDVKTAFLVGEPGKEINFDTDDQEGETSPQETWLGQCWRKNRKLTTLHKIALNGSVCGNSYVKVMRPPNGWQYPRLISLDPAIVKPTWNPDDIDEVLEWRIRYTATSSGGQVVYKQQLIQPSGNVWEILDQERLPQASEWQTVRREMHPFTWAPIFHCQNLPDPNVFWGLSDIEPDVVNLNNALNFILSNINRILRFHAHPKTWGRGFREEQLKVAVDETIVLESPDAHLENLEMLSDLSSSITFYQEVRRALREVVNVPEVAFGGIEDPSRVSSLALKLLYGPLLMLTGRKRVTYGEMLSELNSGLLEMGGFGSGIEVSNKWPFVLPEDPKSEAETLLLDQQLGLSKETALKKRGYDAADEAVRRQDEGENLGAQLLRAFERGDEDV